MKDMNYFKYRMNVIKDEEGHYRDIQTLLNDSLYASAFRDLNDPFEAIYDDMISKTVDLLHTVTGINTEEVVKSWERLQGFYEKVGIYSLVRSSSMPEDELMWSFYADSHRGFCIEYDVEKLVMSEKLRQNVDIVPVTYSKRPPRITVHDINSHCKMVEKMFGTKSLNWKKEQEARLIYNVSGIKKYYPQALKSVFFGCRMPTDLQELVIEGLKGKDVDFYRMERTPGSYTLRSVYLCSNTRGIPELFSAGDYELLSYSKNNVVENFHVWYKRKDNSKEKLLSFVQWYREKYAVKDKSNVFLYDSPDIKSIINKYPLSGREEELMARHNIAESVFDLPGEIWLYPLRKSK